jgi:hypothetical protein
MYLFDGKELSLPLNEVHAPRRLSFWSKRCITLSIGRNFLLVNLETTSQSQGKEEPLLDSRLYSVGAQEGFLPASTGSFFPL